MDDVILDDNLDRGNLMEVDMGLFEYLHRIDLTLHERIMVEHIWIQTKGLGGRTIVVPSMLSNLRIHRREVIESLEKKNVIKILGERRQGISLMFDVFLLAPPKLRQKEVGGRDS